MFFQKACQGSILHFMEFSANPMEHLTEGEMEINDEKIPGQEPPAFLINTPQKFRGWIIPTVSSIRLWHRSGRGLKDRALKGNSPIKTAFGRGGRGIGGMSSFYSKRALLLDRALFSHTNQLFSTDLLSGHSFVWTSVMHNQLPSPKSEAENRSQARWQTV